MTLEIKYPVMARAVRKGGRNECLLMGSVKQRVDVPQIAAYETAQVTSPMLMRGDIVKSGQSREGMVRELRVFEGKLYRFVLPGGDASGDVPMFTKAFPNLRHSTYDYVHWSYKADYSRDIYPLTRPVFAVFWDRLTAMGMHDASARNKTYPKGTGWSSYQDNEDADFMALASEAHSVNAGDVEESLAMHRRQSDRLLIVDDGLWYESRPPCIAVNAVWEEYKPSKSCVRIDYRFLPDTMDQSPSTLYFPLHAVDAARETAERLCREMRMFGVQDRLPGFEVPDHPAFDFNTAEEAVKRTGQAVAMNLLNFAAIRPDKFEDIDPDWLAGIHRMFHEHNPVLGREVDYASALPQLVETYLAMSPHKIGGMQDMQKVELRKALPRMVEMLDELPISIHEFGNALRVHP